MSAVCDASLPTQAHGPLQELAVAVSLDSKGTLRITGTERDDRVTVRRKGSILTVTTDSEGAPENIVTFDYTQIRRIVANLGNGDDVFAAKGSVTKRIRINGDGGNDNLLGGSAADRIDGGAGDDVIVGAGGIDELIGGSGRDFIDALAGESLGFSNPPSSAPDVILAKDGEVDTIIDGASEKVEADVIFASPDDPSDFRSSRIHSAPILP